MVRIEIDGIPLEAEQGQMIIEVADAAGIRTIPRFCYHKELSIAANCRMCLVEVANGRKTVPACATPIAEGMKVYTRSEQVLISQKAVMDFLLINHPLDCPICDQGGECELQDVSMGFGRDVSLYAEEKRSVADENLGPLIATEMTRCIHCTRCVRFGDEVAGLPELGATGRGEKVKIGTYVQHSLTSEISGNIIDLCPVGALTAKPSRFMARPWELQAKDSIAPHDCLGSNIHAHVRRNQLIRVVPKENPLINECWLSDRDRFSYLGLKSEHRAARPAIKVNGQWKDVDWQEALEFAVSGMTKVIKSHGPEQFAAFASPSATVEELYLLQKMLRELGVNNLDYRIRQVDFRDQEQLPVVKLNSLSYAEIEKQKHILLLGFNIEREIPLAGVRVRKASRAGAKIYSINCVDYDFHFDVAEKIIVSPLDLPLQLASILRSMRDDLNDFSPEVQRLLVGLEPSESARLMAQALQEEGAAILTGAIFENHPQAALLRTLVHEIERSSKAKVLNFTTGANAAGAEIAGMLPHRGAVGKEINVPGLDAREAIEAKLKGYLLFAVEPAYDFSNPYKAHQSMLRAEFVVVFSAFAQKSMLDYADVILPITPFTESSGTYINVEAHWQTVKAVVPPYEQARPGWKVLRVLANLFHCKEFDYLSSEDVLNEVTLLHKVSAKDLTYQPYYPLSLPVNNKQLVRVGEWPLYGVDSIVREAQALQDSAAADASCIKIHPLTANRLKLDDVATVSQGDIEITLALKRDERIALDVIWVANAMPESVDLGDSFAAINIKR